MTDWQTIDTAPDDFKRPGGQRPVHLRDRDGRETTGRRALFNNSGWREENTNRELWPTHWGGFVAAESEAS